MLCQYGVYDRSLRSCVHPPDLECPQNVGYGMRLVVNSSCPELYAIVSCGVSIFVFSHATLFSSILSNRFQMHFLGHVF